MAARTYVHADRGCSCTRWYEGEGGQLATADGTGCGAARNPGGVIACKETSNLVPRSSHHMPTKPGCQLKAQHPSNNSMCSILYVCAALGLGLHALPLVNRGTAPQHDTHHRCIMHAAGGAVVGAQNRGSMIQQLSRGCVTAAESLCSSPSLHGLQGRPPASPYCAAGQIHHLRLGLAAHHESR